MNDRIKLLAEQAGVDAGQTIANTICGDDEWVALGNEFNKLSQKTRDLIYKTLEQNQEKFAQLIVKECIHKIEKYRIPVGNSAAGEMACEWTYDALKEIRDEIKKHFGDEE
jgi:hypothetical protein